MKIKLFRLKIISVFLTFLLSLFILSSCSPKLIAFSNYGREVGPSVATSAEIPGVEKYEIDSLIPIKIGVGNGSNKFSYGKLIISAGNFEISSNRGERITDELIVEYYDFNAGTKHYPKYPYERTDEGRVCQYHERIYLRYIGEGSTSGAISVFVFGGTEASVLKSGDGVDFYYATDGEYIAFSVESEKKAQAALN